MLHLRTRLSLGIKRALWSTLWIFFLSAPMVYYRMRGSTGLLWIIFAVVITPLAATVAYAGWQMWSGGKAHSIAKITASFFASTLALVTCVYLWTEPPLESTLASPLVTRDVLWFVAGVLMGLIVVLIPQQVADRLRFVAFAVAVYESVQGFKTIGIPGLTLGLALAGGLMLGFGLRRWAERLWHHFSRLWKDLTRYQWEFATFIVGYVLIIYVFAGLFAVLTIFKPKAFGNQLTATSSFFDFAFFSMLTVSTLGYSDSTPVTPGAKVLVAGEVLCGIFWLTVIFARLSAHAQEREQARQRKRNRRNQIAKDPD